MKITLYNAISADGFIAKLDFNSEWVSEIDSVEFEKACKDAGCIFVGRKTYDQYYEEIYPMKDAFNIVLSSNSTNENSHENVAFAKSVGDAMQIAESKGFQSAILVGGSTVNTSFIKENVIDELILSVHPLLLGKGINIFRDVVIDKELDFVSVKQLEKGLIQLKYTVLK